MEQGAYDRRRAPYAPISALREFFKKIRNTAVPARIDRKFVQKLNVASNNEWALLSALKFLGIVDEHGAPTHVYRRLQTTDQFTETLGHLVRAAYQDLFEAGGLDMSPEDLENYFRVTSSASQAKNAARFFREVAKMAGIEGEVRSARPTQSGTAQGPSPNPKTAAVSRAPALAPRSADSDLLLQAKAHLLEKLPVHREEWSAEEYKAICDRFLAMLESLDR